MNVTITRHAEYNKFIITVENNYEVKQFTVYDMTISEVADFVRGITKE